MGFNAAFKGIKDKHWYIKKTTPYEMRGVNNIVSLNKPFSYWFSEVPPRKHVLKCRLLSLSFAKCSLVWTKRIARKLSTVFPLTLSEIDTGMSKLNGYLKCKAEGEVSAKHTVEMMFVAGMFPIHKSWVCEIKTGCCWDVQNMRLRNGSRYRI